MLAAGAMAAGGIRPRRLIETGRHKPDQERLKQNIARMEKRPFGGGMVNVIGRRDDGTPCGIRAAHGPEPWKRSWFHPAFHAALEMGVDWIELDVNRTASTPCWL